MTRTYNMIWCNDCEDAWIVRTYRCTDGDAAPVCEQCGSNDTETYGAGEE